MASTLYIGFDRDDGLPGLRKDVSLATADLDRISVAYAKLYFPDGVLIPGSPEVPSIPGQEAIPYQPAIPPTLDADGNIIDPGQPEVLAQDAVPEVPGVPGVPDSYRPPTGEEVFAALVKGLLNGMLDNTIRVEKTEAAKAAEGNVPPIPVEV